MFQYPQFRALYIHFKKIYSIPLGRLSMLSNFVVFISVTFSTLPNSGNPLKKFKASMFGLNIEDIPLSGAQIYALCTSPSNKNSLYIVKLFTP